MLLGRNINSKKLLSLIDSDSLEEQNELSISELETSLAELWKKKQAPENQIVILKEITEFIYKFPEDIHHVFRELFSSIILGLQSINHAISVKKSSGKGILNDICDIFHILVKLFLALYSRYNLTFYQEIQLKDTSIRKDEGKLKDNDTFSDVSRQYEIILLFLQSSELILRSFADLNPSIDDSLREFEEKDDQNDDFFLQAPEELSSHRITDVMSNINSIFCDFEIPRFHQIASASSIRSDLFESISTIISITFSLFSSISISIPPYYKDKKVRKLKKRVDGRSRSGLYLPFSEETISSWRHLEDENIPDFDDIIGNILSLLTQPVSFLLFSVVHRLILFCFSLGSSPTYLLGSKHSIVSITPNISRVILILGNSRLLNYDWTVLLKSKSKEKKLYSAFMSQKELKRSLFISRGSIFLSSPMFLVLSVVEAISSLESFQFSEMVCNFIIHAISQYCFSNIDAIHSLAKQKGKKSIYLPCVSPIFLDFMSFLVAIMDIFGKLFSEFVDQKYQNVDIPSFSLRYLYSSTYSLLSHLSQGFGQVLYEILFHGDYSLTFSHKRRLVGLVLHLHCLCIHNLSLCFKNNVNISIGNEEEEEEEEGEEEQHRAIESNNKSQQTQSSLSLSELFSFLSFSIQSLETCLDHVLASSIQFRKDSLGICACLGGIIESLCCTSMRDVQGKSSRYFGTFLKYHENSQLSLSMISMYAFSGIMQYLSIGSLQTLNACDLDVTFPSKSLISLLGPVISHLNAYFRGCGIAPLSPSITWDELCRMLNNDISQILGWEKDYKSPLDGTLSKESYGEYLTQNELSSRSILLISSWASQLLHGDKHKSVVSSRNMGNIGDLNHIKHILTCLIICVDFTLKSSENPSGSISKEKIREVISSFGSSSLSLPSCVNLKELISSSHSCLLKESSFDISLIFPPNITHYFLVKVIVSLSWAMYYQIVSNSPVSRSIQILDDLSRRVPSKSKHFSNGLFASFGNQILPFHLPSLPLLSPCPSISSFLTPLSFNSSPGGISISSGPVIHMLNHLSDYIMCDDSEEHSITFAMTLNQILSLHNRESPRDIFIVSMSLSLIECIKQLNEAYHMSPALFYSFSQVSYLHALASSKHEGIAKGNGKEEEETKGGKNDILCQWDFSNHPLKCIQFLNQSHFHALVHFSLLPHYIPLAFLLIHARSSSLAPSRRLMSCVIDILIKTIVPVTSMVSSGVSQWKQASSASWKTDRTSVDSDLPYFLEDEGKVIHIKESDIMKYHFFLPSLSSFISISSNLLESCSDNLFSLALLALSFQLTDHLLPTLSLACSSILSSVIYAISIRDWDWIVRTKSYCCALLTTIALCVRIRLGKRKNFFLSKAQAGCGEQFSRERGAIQARCFPCFWSEKVYQIVCKAFIFSNSPEIAYSLSLLHYSLDPPSPLSFRGAALSNSISQALLSIMKLSSGSEFDLEIRKDMKLSSDCLSQMSILGIFHSQVCAFVWECSNVELVVLRNVQHFLKGKCLPGSSSSQPIDPSGISKDGSKKEGKNQSRDIMDADSERIVRLTIKDVTMASPLFSIVLKGLPRCVHIASSTNGIFSQKAFNILYTLLSSSARHIFEKNIQIEIESFLLHERFHGKIDRSNSFLCFSPNMLILLLICMEICPRKETIVTIHTAMRIFVEKLLCNVEESEEIQPKMDEYCRMFGLFFYKSFISLNHHIFLLLFSVICILNDMAPYVSSLLRTLSSTKTLSYREGIVIGTIREFDVSRSHEQHTEEELQDMSPDLLQNPFVRHQISDTLLASVIKTICVGFNVNPKKILKSLHLRKDRPRVWKEVGKIL
ncbi:hypothetical protein ADUPG1_005965 [Aduncisulcus paluster]|uniref:Nucleolar 27S pre-rRNA processing Urb2/Npa2 C-terminal domain-containing protein n=1 Tax=Aduncisulcus paluster TaxID=2918883 RepID=A0ABQ5KGA4_9EUKA|nr:hypothetical protein ADUPG1_005965 [Aduncisulcus paluster]